MTSKLLSIKIDNIINKYLVPVSHLDDNIINETDSLLLNKSKSSIIEVVFDKTISIKYYKILLTLSNNSITINNQTYTNYYEYGKITSIQLFGSNNIDFSDEIEIESARYNDISINVNSEIIKTFENDKSFQYYRLKLINNFDYYPYNITNINNTNDILKYT